MKQNIFLNYISHIILSIQPLSPSFYLNELIWTALKFSHFFFLGCFCERENSKGKFDLSKRQTSQCWLCWEFSRLSVWRCASALSGSADGLLAPLTQRWLCSLVLCKILISKFYFSSISISFYFSIFTHFNFNFILINRKCKKYFQINIFPNITHTY